jgi:hypothetical protein
MRLEIRRRRACTKFTLNAPDGEDTLHNYLKLYVLASKLLIQSLQNAVMFAVFCYVKNNSYLCPALKDM